MNFLQLCQALRAEAGLSGAGPSSVVSQTGMYGMLVGWIGQAYAEILKMHPWEFLWARVDSTPLTIAQSLYATSALGASDVGKMYRTKMFDITTPGINRINYVQWKTIDEATPTTGTPRYWSRRPDGKVVFAPIPASSSSSLAFTTGTSTINVGDTIVNNSFGNSAYVTSVNLTSGSWAGGNAAGTLTLTNVIGAFTASDPIKVAGTTKATAAGSVLSGSAISIKYDYLRDGHTLAANTDEPLIPDASLHKIIVMRALTYYGLYDENQSAMADGDRQFNLLLGQMCERYLPQLIGTPLTLDLPENSLAQELV